MNVISISDQTVCISLI